MKNKRTCIFAFAALALALMLCSPKRFNMQPWFLLRADPPLPSDYLRYDMGAQLPVPVVGRIAWYFKIDSTGGRASVDNDRERLALVTDNLRPFVGRELACIGQGGPYETKIYAVKGMDSLQYVISEEPDGTLWPWEFMEFSYLSGDPEDAEWEEEWADSISPGADLSRCSLGQALALIHNVDGAKDIRRVTLSQQEGDMIVYSSRAEVRDIYEKLAKAMLVTDVEGSAWHTRLAVTIELKSGVVIDNFHYYLDTSEATG